MLRSSAKNHAYVTIATSPSQYEELMTEMSSTGVCVCGCVGVCPYVCCVLVSFLMLATQHNTTKYHTVQYNSTQPPLCRSVGVGVGVGVWVCGCGVWECGCGRP